MADILDAHQHFWQLNPGRMDIRVRPDRAGMSNLNEKPFNYSWLDSLQNSSIRRDFLPEDLEPHLRAVSVKQTIFVQTQHNLDENRWVLGLAENHPFIAGVVGWVDLASEACEEQLLEFKKHPKFVGVRHVTQDELDDDFIVRADILRGLKILEKHQVPFDLLFYVKHLRHVPALARHLPNLPMVIDHLAKPNIKERRLNEWLPHFRAAAAFPNVYCKLSGLITEADWQSWTAADLKPYVQTALECFGPERCMFGSDWPVCELVGSYEQVHGALVEALGPLSAGDRAAIFGDTARRFYGIGKGGEGL